MLKAGVKRMARSNNISLTLSTKRSRTKEGFPQSGGGETPSGGGRYLETNENISPVKSSGGHVENAIVPPGFNTLSISEIATSGRGANMCPNWLRTKSNSEF